MISWRKGIATTRSGGLGLSVHIPRRCLLCTPNWRGTLCHTQLENFVDIIDQMRADMQDRASAGGFERIAPQSRAEQSLRDWQECAAQAVVGSKEEIKEVVE